MLKKIMALLYLYRISSKSFKKSLFNFNVYTSTNSEDKFKNRISFPHMRYSYQTKIISLLPVYNDLSIEISKSPPTRDKLQPENKAQVRLGRDVTGKKNSKTAFFIETIFCCLMKFNFFYQLS